MIRLTNKESFLRDSHQTLDLREKRICPKSLAENHLNTYLTLNFWGSRETLSPPPTLLPAVHFLEQAFAGADFSTEKFSAALSLISAALFQCPKIAKFSVAHFFKLSCDLRCSFSIAKSRKILRCSSSDI